MSLHPLGWLVIGLYAAALLAIASRVARKQESSEGYFLAGHVHRRVSPGHFLLVHEPGAGSARFAAKEPGVPPRKMPGTSCSPVRTAK
jgi:hypothetical protein